MLSCGVEDEEGTLPISQLDPAYVSHPVELMLMPGNLDAGLGFEQVDLPLSVTESYDLVPVQVGAFILELNEHDPDYLRIKFSSDRIEWVGYSTDTADIYDSEEECLSHEDYCESVEVGAGESGYFEFQDGYIGIQNAYCRYAEESYAYNITAVAYDLYVWPHFQISEPIDIEISCQVSE
jgi:hypothetical protein